MADSDEVTLTQQVGEPLPLMQQVGEPLPLTQQVGEPLDGHFNEICLILLFNKN